MGMGVQWLTCGFIFSMIILMSFSFLPSAFSDDASGVVFYTLFDESNPINVKSADYLFDDDTESLIISAITEIAKTSDADGIVINPQDPDLLIVGTAFDLTLESVEIATGDIISFQTIVGAFHFEVADPTTVYVSPIPGDLVKHTINPDGTIGAAVPITLSGDEQQITQPIKFPGGFFYTTSDRFGIGSYGTLEFTSETEATQTNLFTDLCGVHGGTYDPFTNTIVTSGSNCINQFDLDGNLLCTLQGGVDFPDPILGNFDQLDVDEQGHIVIAQTGGDLYLVDYSQSGDLCDDSTVVANTFLDNTLDDLTLRVDEAEPRTRGFWKNHEDETAEHLPITIGNLDVTDFDTAKLVFKANAKNAHDMLAAQLLAAEINVWNGVPNCVEVDDAISDAQLELVDANYMGPGTTTAPQNGDKVAVNAIKDILDDYNNNGCS